MLRQTMTCLFIFSVIFVFLSAIAHTQPENKSRTEEVFPAKDPRRVYPEEECKDKQELKEQSKKDRTLKEMQKHIDATNSFERVDLQRTDQTHK